VIRPGLAKDLAQVVYLQADNTPVTALTIEVQVRLELDGDGDDGRFWSTAGVGSWVASSATHPNATHKGGGLWVYTLPAKATTTKNGAQVTAVFSDDIDDPSSATTMAQDIEHSIRASAELAPNRIEANQIKDLTGAVHLQADGTQVSSLSMLALIRLEQPGNANHGKFWDGDSWETTPSPYPSATHLGGGQWNYALPAAATTDRQGAHIAYSFSDDIGTPASSTTIAGLGEHAVFKAAAGSNIVSALNAIATLWAATTPPNATNRPYHRWTQNKPPEDVSGHRAFWFEMKTRRVLETYGANLSLVGWTIEARLHLSKKALRSKQDKIDDILDEANALAIALDHGNIATTGIRFAVTADDGVGEAETTDSNDLEIPILLDIETEES